jgi:predicted metalloprotease with PDZ domain
MPVWTPGSYLVREFARNVEEFSAVDGSGAPLEWSKISKNLWRIRSKRASRLRLNYRVYAFERSVRTSFLDDTHGTINGASLFMFVGGYPDIPHRLIVEPAPSWHQVTTGLEQVAGEKDTFLAPDYDTLIDCPVEIGTHQVSEFIVGGVPHRVALCGRGNHDPARICADLQKIVERAFEVFGHIPYSHYTFLIHLTADGGSGLEHANSTLLQVHRWTFKPEESYRRFLELAAHEYFHVWNVKRLRPEGLGPFDYSRENYTRQLWVSEGFTDYYAEQILRRAGFLTAEQYLEGLTKAIRDLQEIPGRLVESVAEASFDAWIKFYRQDQNFPNKSVSYYLKGGLIGLLLDLEIRKRAEGRCLDDVLRHLYARYWRKLGRGFSEGEFRAACEKIAGGSLEEFFADYCYGTREMDFARCLEYAGLKFRQPATADEKPQKAYLGISAKTVEGRLMIVGVTRGSPAFEQGLNLNDEIIAAGGFRMNQELLTARITELAPGTKIDLLVARDGQLLMLPTVLGAQEPQDYGIERVADPTPGQKRIYEQWLRAKWDEPPPDNPQAKIRDPQ